MGCNEIICWLYSNLASLHPALSDSQAASAAQGSWLPAGLGACFNQKNRLQPASWQMFCQGESFCVNAQIDSNLFGRNFADFQAASVVQAAFSDIVFSEDLRAFARLGYGMSLTPCKL